MTISRELCRVTCEDGLVLDGAFWTPAHATPRPAPTPVDAFLLVHGAGGNFYSPGVLERFAEQAVEAGTPVLRVNTRGHDGIAHIPGTPRGQRGGAAYENIADCRKDLRAWAAWLAEQDRSRIALVGHSLGGVKCIYTLAQDPLPGVCCMIGVSPPRFCHARLWQHPLAEPFREDFERAQELVNAGRGDALISARQPLPLVLTAEGFLAKYGPQDEYDQIRWLPHIGCPALILVGTESLRTSPAFAGLDADLQSLQQRRAGLTCEIIEGANTGYSGCLEAPFRRAWTWLTSLGRAGE